MAAIVQPTFTIPVDRYVPPLRLSLPPNRARRARAPFRRPSDVGRCLFHLSVTTAKRRDERGGLRKRERAPRASLRR